MGKGAPGSVTEGAPGELGATLAGDGVNFAVYSAHASAIEVCLFDGHDAEIARIALPGRTGPVFHGHVAGLAAGARYGLRAHGPFAPWQGCRFNPNKLLVDPYALALDRPFALAASLFGYLQDDPQGGDSFDPADSAPDIPKALVVAPPRATTKRPATPWGRTVIYEMHVRGFTKRCPDIPEALRGTFAGLAHPAAVAHLKRLGVTAVELLPTAAWIDERHLPPLGLTNYWGYNPVALMAPDPRLAPGGWAEVAAATKALAAAGIETLLDVVFNHTGESDALGPTLSLRGLDNASYYRLSPDNRARYVDDAGTGNVLALDDPAALRLTLDALRAWARFGGVHGFRFDLATVLGRRADGFDPAAPLLSALDQDPELRALKLIAEPWDCGPGGYQLGAFPPAWGEWNDRFRDTVRSFWRGDPVSRGELATRIAGSQDVFGGRPPSRSINFIVAHDGFTLADLTAFRSKQNLANGENNRDGADDNRSWNNGVEGPTDDPGILRARRNDQKALLATLMLARGTPMLTMGAEFGQSQGGNNNAYAQDSEIGWLDWARSDADLMAFTAGLAKARADHPALRADRFLRGDPGSAGGLPDVEWRRADGAILADADWQDQGDETLVMVVAEPAGETLDRVALIIHRGPAPVVVALPEPRDGMAWSLAIDSADGARCDDADQPSATVAPRSAVLLVETPAPRRAARPTDAKALGRLAAAAGIAPDWWSLDGEGHAVSPDTQRALLAAMGLPADTTQQARASLHRFAETQDHRPLPAVLARRIGEPIEVPLRFAPGGPPPRTWLVVEGEDGATVRQRAAADLCVETAFVGADGRAGRALVARLAALAPGRYRLRREDCPGAVCFLTVAPRTAFMPDRVARGARLTGVSTQLYSVRRGGDQGIGDFTTLGALGEAAAGRGCGMLGINPLHALFNDRRERASPYYPSDRRFLDPIYLDLAATPFAGERGEAFDALSAAAAIDYPQVWALKAKALEQSFAKGREHPDFAAFVTAGGEALQQFATFQAITETKPGKAWRAWPANLRAPGPGVAAFARAHPDRVAFHQYLQWLCDLQLGAAAGRAAGLALGFCRDLAIGAAPEGAETWAMAGLVAHGVSIGAPPDPLGPQGQVWGLPPLDPHRIKVDGYRAHGALFAANMRHAGALRIDHAMGLARQFWVPEGAEGSQGAYVAYPLHDLLGELALESDRARCMVIGEDLGTVPNGFRETLAEAGVLGYRVLPFERDGRRFRRPEHYPVLAWACVATHDLPTLIGWWQELDIAERLDLGIMTPAAALDARADRDLEKQDLLEALVEADLIPAKTDVTGDLTLDLIAAIHAYVAMTPSVLAVAQLEDLAGERTAINLPGTDRERPNWRRRIATPLEDIFDAPAAQAILAAMQAARTHKAAAT